MMRDNKDVSLVPMGSGSNQHELELFSGTGEHTPKEMHLLGRIRSKQVMPPLLPPAWIGPGFGNSEDKKGYGGVSVVPVVMTCLRRSGLMAISPVNGRLYAAINNSDSAMPVAKSVNAIAQVSRLSL
jgi:hypothetical protein